MLDEDARKAAKDNKDGVRTFISKLAAKKRKEKRRKAATDNP